MKKLLFASALFLLASLPARAEEAATLRVVTTLPDYEVLVREIGGERVTARAIVRGDQDAHFIRPKPSFVSLVAEADVLVATGLDLELWLPTVVNKSGNVRVRSGARGFVSASHGMELLEKPSKLSASEGHVHIYGNPHVTTDPLRMKQAARNIAEGLSANDPEGRSFYEANADRFCAEVDRRLFGAKLVELLGGATLCKLASKGRLLAFLRKHSYGKPRRPLLAYLGGWMGRMLPLRGVPVVTYHKNWIYFFRLFGIEEAGTVEPKPGIPPSTRHTAELIESMRKGNVRLILAANYFNQSKVRDAASAVGAEPVLVPYYVGGEPGVDHYFTLVDTWVDRLLAAARKTGVLPGGPGAD